MAALFAVGLIALEIVDGGSDPLPLLLSGQTAWTVWPTARSAWNGT